MPSSKFYDLARMLSPTTGAGSTITLTGPVNSFLSFALAGAQDGDPISYAIDDGNNREVGHTVYHAGPPITLNPRTVVASTNGNSPINLSGNAQVSITAIADDLILTADMIVAADPPYLKLTGGTLTGSLHVTGGVRSTTGPDTEARLATSSFGSSLYLNAPDGVSANVFGQQQATTMWRILLGDGTPRPGGNVGSDFVINRHLDDGVTAESVLRIRRNDGVVVVTRNVQANMATPNPTVIGSMPGYGLGIDLNNSGNMFATTGPDGISCYTSWTLRWRSMNDGNFYITGNGGKPGGGAWFDSSDARIKTVHGPYVGGLDAIRRLNPVRYTFKGNDSELHTADGIERIGLIAQEVETVMPECVTQKAGKIDGEDVTDLRVLDTSPMLFAAINAIKQLADEIDEMQTQINALGEDTDGPE